MGLRSMILSLALALAGISAFAQGIVNGNFDLGNTTGWSVYSKGGYGIIGTAAFFASTEISPPVVPRSGQFMARLGGFSYEVNSLSQTVQLPATTPLYLKLSVQDRNSTTSECAGLWVGSQIRVAVAGQVIYDTYLCYYNQSESWVNVYFDLSAVAGQTVQIAFQADAANSVWSYLYIDDVTLTNSLTDIEKEKSLLPATIVLKQNYPNPFSAAGGSASGGNPSTKIVFEIPTPMHATVTICDILGREVARLASRRFSAGTHAVEWNARGLTPGIYFCRLQAENYTETKKLLLIK